VQVAYAWAMHLEVEEKKGPAARLSVLRKMGLVDYAIDYAAESGDFENAFVLAIAAKATSKLPEIHLKHAMHLEVCSSIPMSVPLLRQPVETACYCFGTAL
jgi:hypothetical protein